METLTHLDMELRTIQEEIEKYREKLDQLIADPVHCKFDFKTIDIHVQRLERKLVELKRRRKNRKR